MARRRLYLMLLALACALPLAARAEFNGPPGFFPFAATGSTTARAPADRANDSINARDDGASGSSASTTGTIGVSTLSTLTLAAASDYKNGQGILIHTAGAAPTIGAITGLGVTNTGTAGAVAYTYAVAPCDSAGGLKAAVTAATATANALLDINNYNTIAWTAGSGDQCYAVWRSADAGATYTFISMCFDTTYDDRGQQIQAQPFWVPASPPLADQNDFAVRIIQAGAGTVNITLTTPVIAAVTTAQVMHDDTAALNRWIARVVASSGAAAGYLPAGTYRHSTALTHTVASNIAIRADAGATLMPAGAMLWSWESNAGGSTASFTLAADIAQGARQVTLTSTSGIVTDNYLRVVQAFPGGQSETGSYNFFMPVKSVDAVNNIVYLKEAFPVPLYTALQKATISGSVRTGDTLQLVATGGLASTTAYVAVAADNTKSNVAAIHLAQAINATSAFATAGCFADSSATVVNLRCPAALGAITWTPTTTHGGGGTESIALTTGTAPTVTRTPLSTNVSIRGLTIDASNAVGTAAAGASNFLGGINFKNLAYSEAIDITCRNFGGGGRCFFADFGYANRFTRISARRGGQVGGLTTAADITIADNTRPTINNLLSIEPGNFGPLLSDLSYAVIDSVSSTTPDTSRGIKVFALLNSTLNGLSTLGAGDTGIAVAGSSRNNTFTGYTSSASQGETGNLECLWLSDQWNINNRFVGGKLANCATNELQTGYSDTGNKFNGLSVSSFAYITDNGLNLFYDLSIPGGASCPFAFDGASNVNPACVWTTGAIGGSPLAAGASLTATATVPGITTAQAIQATPVTNPGTGYAVRAYRSSTDTVTVEMTNVTTGSQTPTSTAFNVRVPGT